MIQLFVTVRPKTMAYFWYHFKYSHSIHGHPLLCKTSCRWTINAENEIHLKSLFGSTFVGQLKLNWRCYHQWRDGMFLPVIGEVHDLENTCNILLYFQGAIFGFLVSISFSLWLAIGTFITKPYSRTKLPTSTANCSSYLAHHNGYRL